ncbi:MAG: NADH-quinone oxidoreductase subunit N, partial [Muribaculaceae bacterium]|nr:NADH-quinone oxidoreductase subunit N [Muribaculaceae bacterium]
MDYSQFWAMKQEIGLLVVFLLVFIFDTFMPKKSLKATAWVAIAAFAVFTATGFCCCNTCNIASAFAGMYVTSPVIAAIKNILNVGVLIVLLQSVTWTKTEEISVRRGEFYELLLVTLFGMYLMISSRHFLLFIIGLESASLPLAAMVAFNKNRYESHEAAIKY